MHNLPYCSCSKQHYAANIARCFKIKSKSILRCYLIFLHGFIVIGAMFYNLQQVLRKKKSFQQLKHFQELNATSDDDSNFIL